MLCMSESIIVLGSAKKEKYESLFSQMKALLNVSKDFIANISNIIASLKYGMNFLWVGIYFVKQNELVLGPFQGPVACTRIASAAPRIDRVFRRRRAALHGRGSAGLACP